MEFTFKPTELTIDDVSILESNEDHDIKRVTVHGKGLMDGEEDVFWGEVIVKVTDEGVTESSANMSFNFQTGNVFMNLVTDGQMSQIIDL